MSNAADHVWDQVIKSTQAAECKGDSNKISTGKSEQNVPRSPAQIFLLVDELRRAAQALDVLPRSVLFLAADALGELALKDMSSRDGVAHNHALLREIKALEQMLSAAYLQNNELRDQIKELQSEREMDVHCRDELRKRLSEASEQVDLLRKALAAKDAALQDLRSYVSHALGHLQQGLRVT